MKIVHQKLNETCFRTWFPQLMVPWRFLLTSSYLRFPKSTISSLPWHLSCTSTSCGRSRDLWSMRRQTSGARWAVRECWHGAGFNETRQGHVLCQQAPVFAQEHNHIKAMGPWQPPSEIIREWGILQVLNPQGTLRWFLSRQISLRTSAVCFVSLHNVYLNLLFA